MHNSRPNLFWPIILIGVGVLLLLDNSGALRHSPWAVIWSLWPLLLIAAGLYVLLGRGGALQSSIAGGLLAAAIVGAVLFLSITDIPGLDLGGRTQTQHIAHPLGNIRNAELNFSFGSGRYNVSALSDSTNLIEGDLTYNGNLNFDVSGSGDRVRVTLNSSGAFFFGIGGGDDWNIGLNRNATYELNLDLGSGGADLDFSDLPLSGGTIDSGSGGATLSLPAGRYTLRIDGGSGSIDIRVPREAEVRVEYQHGSGGFFSSVSRLAVDGYDDFDAETSGFASAENAITLVIDGGSGSIGITE